MSAAAVLSYQRALCLWALHANREPFVAAVAQSRASAPRIWIFRIRDVRTYVLFFAGARGNVIRDAKGDFVKDAPVNVR